MSPDEDPPLRERLEKAEHRLGAVLGEVCDDASVTDVRRPNTGELVRLDEELALASQAVKQAISLRRRLRADSRKNHDARQPDVRAE